MRRAARIWFVLAMVVLFASGAAPALASYPAACAGSFSNSHFGSFNTSDDAGIDATGSIATIDIGSYHHCTEPGGGDDDHGFIAGAYLFGHENQWNEGQVGAGYWRADTWFDSGLVGCTRDGTAHYYVIVETWKVLPRYQGGCFEPDEAPAPSGNDFKVRIDEIDNDEWWVYFDFDNDGNYDSTNYAAVTNSAWTTLNKKPRAWLERFDQAETIGVSTNKTNLYNLKYRVGGVYNNFNGSCGLSGETGGNPVENVVEVATGCDVWFS